MWCPQGYHSWNSVLDHLIRTSEDVLSLVVTQGEPPPTDPIVRAIHTAEYYLQHYGFAASYEEAELHVTLTACFLMAHFLEEYPPLLAGLNGQMITLESTFLEHRDQLQLCNYGWPLKSQREFADFFRLGESGIFQPKTVFDRFAFIDAVSGEFRVKNGAEQFLNGHTVFSEEEIQRLIDQAKTLSGFVICWEDLPNDSEFRNFLSYLEVDDAFTRPLDQAYGPASEARKPEATPKRPVGRPSKQSFARDAYWSCFPNGHESERKSWKEAHLAVEAVLEVKIDLATLKRAIRNTRN